HGDFDPDWERKKRGRVCLYAGTFVIYIGLECPDHAIEEVKKLFGLFKDSYRVQNSGVLVSVSRNEYWDGNSAGKIESASIGLFFLLNDSSEINVYDEHKIDMSDLGNENASKSPDKNHEDFKTGSAKYYRGRVSLYKGVIYVVLGNTCPPDVIERIKVRFGLDKIDKRFVVVEPTTAYDPEY
ncbi:MAG: hypothetical protein LBI03_06210, partial [Clostridiales bacterium]|nr:hypothetical protein [Clostridiales bacterium]